MFRGRYEHLIDPKGRLSLPSRFREVLSQKGDHTLVVTTHLEPCLIAYPQSEWEIFEERLRRMPQFSPEVRSLLKVYVHNAADCQLDGHGRILLPQNLRDYAGLMKDVVITGSVSSMEIWSKPHLDDSVAEARKDVVGLQRALGELGL